MQTTKFAKYNHQYQIIIIHSHLVLQSLKALSIKCHLIFKSEFCNKFQECTQQQNNHISMFILYIILALFTQSARAGSIVSNIPTVVTSTKNYTTAQPTWVTSPFFRAGNQAVIKTLTGNSSTPTYTFTFSSALPGLPNLAYGIKNYRGNDYFGQEFYQIKKIGLTQATFSVSIQIYGVTNLWLLTVAYLAVDPTFPHHLNTFDNVPLNYSSGPILNITNYSANLNYFVEYINYTEQSAGRKFTYFTNPLSSNSIVLYMTSFWVRASFGSGGTYYPVQFHVQTSILNQSYYFWNATLRVQCLVTNVHFSQIIFNTNDVQSSKKYFIVFQKWYNDLNGGFIEIPQEFVDNFIMGITSFETVDGHCGFQYQWQFVTQSTEAGDVFGVQILYSWTLTNTCGFSWSESSIFYMETWLCEAPFYYFNLTSSLCQTLCGGYNFQNSVNFTCDPCDNTNCYQCNFTDTTICTTCATYLLFQLVNNTCQCIGGYFQTSDICQPCSYGSTGCINCTYNDGANGSLTYTSSLFNCTVCNNSANYFVNNKICTLCTMSLCTLCQNLTACSICNTGYNLSSILTCVHCYVTGCAYCSSTNSNVCAICNNSLGYYNDSATQKCKTQCGDGILVSATEACDDNNTVSYDGCSSTCTVQSSFTCSGSPSACYFVTNPTIALKNTIMETQICDTITFTIQISPSSLTFSQSNVKWNNFLVTPNASLFIPNTSMFVYSSGNLSASFFLLKTIQNKNLTFTADFTSLILNSSIFNHTTSPTITFTVNPTNNIVANLTCCVGFYLNSTQQKCLQICGDGLLFLFQCDDGNLINGDGCSSQCAIETNYVCINGSSNTSSICSYNGPISISITTGIKDPTSNSLTLSYTITPIGPILSLVNGSTDLSSYISYPGASAVSIISAIYDPISNQVIVQVSYNDSIQGQPLNLKFDPPNTPQAYLVPNLTSSWTVSPTNHLSAELYSQSDYNTVQKLSPFSKGLLGGYLAVAAVSIFFRKFIGLELAVIYQISYISILQNNKISPYLQPVTNWKYTFGYNHFYLTSPSNTTAIDSAYSLYDYQKDFGFAVNLMMIITASVYGLGIVLYLISAITTKSASRKMKVAGYTVINDVGYTLVVYSTVNIITAFCIQISQHNATEFDLLWSKAFMIVSIVLIFVSNFINFFTAQQSSDVGTFYRKHSKSGIYAPIIFNLRLIILTVFIFLHSSIKNTSSYIILSTQFMYIIFIAFGRPHKKPIDLIRSLLIEISLFSILMTRFLEIEVIQNVTSQKDTNYYQIMAYIQYSQYGLVDALSVASLIYHFAKKLKKNKITPDQDIQDKKAIEQGKSIKFPNQSMTKLQQNSIPSKRGNNSLSKNNSNSLIFDLQDMQIETYGTSTIKLDQQSPKRATRRRQK